MVALSLGSLYRGIGAPSISLLWKIGRRRPAAHFPQIESAGQF
jgi:hypothetical protein